MQTSSAQPPRSRDQRFLIGVELDRESSVPLYQQIAGPLEQAIVSGEAPAGGLIEDEISMANRLDVSRPTARRALQELVDKGLLSRRRGVGTRVNPSQIHRPVGMTSLEDDLRKAGFETRTDVLNYQVKFADSDEAAILECEEGEEIVVIERLRWSNEEPLAVMKNLLLADLAPTLRELSSQGLYQSLRDRGAEMTTGRQEVSARNSDVRAATLLQVSAGDAVLTMKRWVYDQAGRVVEYGDHIYNPALYTLSFASVAE